MSDPIVEICPECGGNRERGKPCQYCIAGAVSSVPTREAQPCTFCEEVKQIVIWDPKNRSCICTKCALSVLNLALQQAEGILRATPPKVDIPPPPPDIKIVRG